MFTYSMENEYEPLRGSAVYGRPKKQAYMIGAGTTVLLLCLFAFSGSSHTAAQQQLVSTSQLATISSPQGLVEEPADKPDAPADKPRDEPEDKQPAPADAPDPEKTDGITLSVAQYDFVYNMLSLAIASMGSATVFFFFQFSLVAAQFKTALVITGLVTLIAFYHYIRIFNSFTEAYASVGGVVTTTGIPFNDAYRYVDWLLTVPLLLTELILVMGLDEEETRSRCLSLGGSAALMIVLGYPGEITDVASTRWIFWALAMLPFLYIVYTLFFGLSQSISQQGEAAGLVRCACYLTVLSWCTYPVVYIFPMLGLSGAGAHTAIQVGYSVADIVAKPLTGLLVWMIAARKSKSEY